MNDALLQSLDEAVHLPEVGLDTYKEPGIISPDVGMMVLTWVTFFLLLAVLYKYAWKPILSGLDAREETIRRSLEEAQQARDELAKVHIETQKMIVAADEKAKHIVDRARKAAVEAARVIEHKANEEAQIILKNAEHEIEAMKDKAIVTLRKESVDLAVSLAEKIIDEELDKEKHRTFVDKLIKEFHPHE